MNISNQALSLLKDFSPMSVSEYLSPTFFDDHFMEKEDNALAKKALVISSLEIAKKMGPAGIFKVSFREAESFLRDNPSASAWQGVLDLKKWFELLLLDIQTSYFEQHLMRNKVEMKSWDDLSLEQRIYALDGFIDNTNSCLDFFGIGQLELFCVEENEVCVNDRISFIGLRPAQANKLKEVIFECVARYLNFSFRSVKIKLVAQ